MGEIEAVDRAREAQEAWRLWVEGKSKAEIARRLERNPRTIDSYLAEAAEWVRNETLETKRAAIVAAHRRIVEKAWEMFESGDIKPTSLAGPQYLMQIREALKEMARIEGMYVDRREVTHKGNTVADLIREMVADMEQDGYSDVDAWLNRKEYEEIEEAEVIDETS